MPRDAKIAIRNVRRDGMEVLKDDEKRKDISEDEHKRLDAEVQKLTDEHDRRGMVKAATLAAKEKEILHAVTSRSIPPLRSPLTGSKVLARGSWFDNLTSDGNFPAGHVNRRKRRVVSPIIMDGNGRWAKARGLPPRAPAISQRSRGGHGKCVRAPPRARRSRMPDALPLSPRRTGAGPTTEINDLMGLMQHALSPSNARARRSAP